MQACRHIVYMFGIIHVGLPIQHIFSYSMNRFIMSILQILRIALCCACRDGRVYGYFENIAGYRHVGDIQCGYTYISYANFFLQN